MRQNVNKSVGQGSIHPRVLREQADVVVEPLSKKLWLSIEVLSELKKRNINPILRKT